MVRTIKNLAEIEKLLESHVPYSEITKKFGTSPNTLGKIRRKLISEGRIKNISISKAVKKVSNVERKSSRFEKHPENFKDIANLQGRITASQLRHCLETLTGKSKSLSGLKAYKKEILKVLEEI